MRALCGNPSILSTELSKCVFSVAATDGESLLIRLILDFDEREEGERRFATYASIIAESVHCTTSTRVLLPEVFRESWLFL